MCILICLAHEGNAEDTFSLSGKLSNDNKKTRPGFLANMVRINKNRAVCDPSPSLILAEYKRVHRHLPTLGDDCTDDEGDEDSEPEEDCDSDGY